MKLNAILTVWKRNNLEEQIEKVWAQSLKPNRVIIWQNESHIDIEPILKKFPFVEHVHCKDTNFKFHGRFTLPLLFDSNDVTHTAIFDDDTIPNPGWLNHAVNWCEKLNGLIGGNGRNYGGGGGGLCDGKYNNDPIRMDIIGHCWVFRTAWVRDMFREPTLSFDNGEDIHFCASNQIYGGRQAYLPPQPINQPSVWADTKWQYGNDQFRTCDQPNHGSLRQEICDYWIAKGWKPQSVESGNV